MWICEPGTLAVRAANPAAMALYGYDLATFQTMTLIDLCREEDAEAFSLSIHEEPEPIASSGHWTHHREDGAALHVDVITWPMDHPERPARMAMVIDRTAEWREQAESREREERFRHYTQLSTEGIWLLELEQPVSIDLPPDEQCEHICRLGYLAECNEAFAQMAGASHADELIGKRWTELFPRADRPEEDLLSRFVTSDHDIEDEESEEADQHGLLHHFSNSITGVTENRHLLRARGVRRDIGQRKRAEEALRQRVLMERLIADIAQSFIHTVGGSAQQNLEKALQRIGEFSRVDRCRLFLISADRMYFNNTMEWCAEGISTQKEHLQNLPMDSFPWWMERLVKFETSCIDRVDDLPPEAKTEKSLLKAQHIQSVLVAPLVFGHSLSGVLSFDTVRRARRWSEEDILILKLAAETLAKALQQQQADAALRDALERFETILEQIPHLAIQGMDRRGRIRHWNTASAKLYGYSLEEAMGRPIQDLILPPDSRAAFEEGLEAIWSTTPPPSEPKQWVVQTKDGKERTIYSSMFPLYAKGRIVEVLCADIILTDQWEAELQMRERERQLQSLFEASPDAIFVEDKQGVILFVNAIACELHGTTPEEMIGRSVFDFIPADRRAQAKEDFPKWFSGEISYYEGESLSKNGAHIRVEIRAKRITFADQAAVLLHVRDITHKKIREEEKIKLQKLESLGRLAGGIAHNFNNVLTVILGNIELARMNTPDADLRAKPLDDAEKACTRARMLSNQLLTFAQGGDPIKRPLALNDLIFEAASFALNGTASLLAWEPEPQLWPVEGDATQLEQVIHQLTTNAHQAMPEGGTVTIRTANLSIEPDDPRPLPPGRYVHVRLRDKGHGISEDLKDHIFDPYFTTRETASGLGLPTTLSIIRKHHGHIALGEAQGPGSVMEIYLPAYDAPLDSGTPPVGSLSGRILVMDDNDGVRRVAIQVLTSAGMEADGAREGQEGLRKIAEARTQGRPYVAAIMDLTVPGGMGGKEMMERLKTEDPTVAGIVSSGYSRDPIMSDFAQYGFSGIAAKPYRAADLIQSVQEALAQKSSA